MIPKVLHHMSPNGQLSKAEQNCINSFAKHNPELKIMHWTDDKTTKFIKQNYDEVFYNNWLSNTKGGPKKRGLLKKWDSARLYILNKLGGVWVDNDCTCLRPLDCLMDYDLVVRKPLYRYTPIYETQYDFTHTPVHICNAFFACCPNNDIIREMIDTITVRFKEDPFKNVGYATACLLWGDVVQERINNNKIGKTYLLEHYEFMEGPEQLEWVPEDKLKELFVVHKINDRGLRYKSFCNKIELNKAKKLFN